MNISRTPVSRHGAMMAAWLAAILQWVLLGTAAWAEDRTVVVGVFDNPPIVQQDTAGGYTGLSVDVLKSVAIANGWQLIFDHGPWHQQLAKLEAGEIDLLVGIAYKPERTRLLDFTQQTLVNNYGLVMRHPKAAITSLLDLRDKRVGLMAKSIHSREFIRMMGEFDIPFVPVEVPSYEAVLQAIASGESDVGVVNRAMSILRGSSNDILTTGIVFNPVEVRYAVPKGRNADLLAGLDQALATQKQNPVSDYNRAMARWMGGQVRERLPHWFPLAAGIAALLLLLLLASNYLIRRQVARRTTQLTESETRFRQLAENIKEVFWVGSPDWKQVNYVSPAYEAVWGMAPEQLYDNPMTWLDPVHPADRESLAAAMVPQPDDSFSEITLPDFRLTDREGRTRWIQARAYPIRDKTGKVVRLAGLADDITERKAAEDTIRFMAYHDPLTRLHNRHAFEARLREAASRSEGGPHALMYVDLDQFKVLNDTCGHAAGDQMLQGLTAHLQRAITRQHTLARLGGDEFGILLEDCDLTEAEAVARQVLDSIQAFRFSWGDNIFSVGASIGLVMVDGDRRPLSGLLSAADIACYAAKDSGRNRIHVYRDDDAMLQQRENEMHWVARLKKALDNDGFVLHAQPIVPLQHADAASHREFLLRMMDEDGQLIPPGNFLPAAERFDLMPTLDRWVVNQVFEHIGQMRNRDGCVAFVNLSGQVLNDDDFISHVLQQLHRHAIPPGSVCLEITETAAIANLTKATRLIETLREQGVLFALDDFGTGMSSFSYLKTLPVDFLKIDGYFIKGLLSDHMNPAIVEAITQIGHTAGLQVIAEWVEDEAMLDRLREIGIDFAQGYALGRPGPLSGSQRWGAESSPASRVSAGN